MTENLKEKLATKKKLQPQPAAIGQCLLKQSAGRAYLAKKLTKVIETLTIDSGNVHPRLVAVSGFFPVINVRPSLSISRKTGM